MKKAMINIEIIIIAIIFYILQQTFFNWFTISGIMPNIMIILVLFIGLFTNKNLGAIYGISIGIIIDLLTSRTVGITAVVYGLVGWIAGVFDKNFSKDNRITIMFIVAATTVIAETAIFIISYLFVNQNIDIWAYIKILLVEVLYNIILSIILYPLIQRFGYYIENEYKGNRILTRYF